MAPSNSADKPNCPQDKAEGQAANALPKADLLVQAA